jgi:hypothetical protein
MRKPLGLLVTWLCLLAILLPSLSAGAHTTARYNGFDDDNYADLAVGVPQDEAWVVGYDTVTPTYSGVVNVLPGSAGGVSGGNEPVFGQGLAAVSGSAEPGDWFGNALAAGDFDGDGYIDLAIGVPGEDVKYQGVDQENAGAVNVIYGSSGGLNPESEPIWHQDVADIPGRPEPWDEFGASLAAGNFNGDEYTDLAIGVPHESLGSGGNGYECGVVHVLYGTDIGLSTTGNQQWTQQDLNLGYNDNCVNTFFGLRLAAGNFDGDEYTDLAVGAPGEGVDGENHAGAVNVLYGTSGGLAATGADRWHQNRDGVAGESTEWNNFGAALAAGDFNSDGYADLAVGVPNQFLMYQGMPQGSAGAVNVLYGSQYGLVGTDAPLWHQDQPGVYGTPEFDDRFGAVLAAGDLNGDGYVDLAIGVPDEDIRFDGTDLENAGAVNILYGSAHGLAGSDEPAWNLGSTGVDDDPDAWDRFGWALAFGDSNGDFYDDLAIGVPYIEIGLVEDVGAVVVLDGTAEGLAVRSDHFWSQNSFGVYGAPSDPDMFGMALVFGQQPRMLIARPGNVSASDGAYDTKVRVTWDGVDCDYYGVYRADTENGVKQLLSAATTTSYEDTDIVQLKSYWYSVKACHTEGDCSAFSDQDKGWATFSWIEPEYFVYLPVVIRSPQE